MMHGQPTDNSPVETQKHDDVSQITLKRNLNLFSGISLVVGSMIGSRLFMMPNIIHIYTAQSPYMSLTTWFIGGLVAFLGAVCYAELATSINVSGGEQAYLTRMYSPLCGFLIVWTKTLIINPGGGAAIALFCAEYIVVNINRGYSESIQDLDDTLTDQSPYIKSAFAILVVGIVSAVNAYSADLGNRMNQVFTTVKLLSIGVICCIGVYWLAKGEWNQLTAPYITPSNNTTTGTTFVGAVNALTLSMWAYGGWSFLSWVTEEIINPDRNIPLALFLGILIVCGVYLLFNLALFCGPVIANGTKTPFILIYARTAWGGWGWFIASFCILTATYGALSSGTITVTRFYHASARDGHLPRALSFCLPSKSTPIVAIIFSFVSTSIYIILGKHAVVVINYVIYTSWVYSFFVVVGSVILRYKHPNMRRPFKAPLAIPIIDSVISMIMILSPFFEFQPPGVYWKNIGAKYGGVIASIVTGIPFYFLCVRQSTRLHVFEVMSGAMADFCKRLGFQ